MNRNLLVCKHLQRDHFEYETYCGRDDILALVEKGSFSVDDGTGIRNVNALEGVCFREGIHYTRHVLQPVTLYLFRFKAGSGIFPSGKVTFRDTGRIRSTIRLLQAAEERGYPDAFSFHQALFQDILNQYRLENPAQVQMHTGSDPVIDRAVSYIQENLHKQLRLPELAAAGYLSQVQFSRRFKAVTGMTVQEYVTDMRMKKAKELLEDTTLSVGEVARGCGYSNAYYFSSFFHRRQNMSPTEYRSLARSTEKL